MTLIHDPNYIALTSMPQYASRINGENLREDKFERSVKMPTYLLAIVICDFGKIPSTTESGVKVSFSYF